jgi:hypothetical protein
MVFICIHAKGSERFALYCTGLYCTLLPSHPFSTACTDKKENKIFLIYGEIQSGAVAKSYMRKGFLIYEEMRKYFHLYEEAVSHK